MRALAFLHHLSTLQITLAVSALVHAGLLTLRIVDPESFNRVFQDTPLEVILVNARSDARAERPTAIAQANLAGGGEASRGRATSPLPSSALSSVGDTLEESQRQLAALEQLQARMLTSVHQQLASLPRPDPNRSTLTPQEQAQEEKRRQLLKLLAEIERRINEENARPKKRYISPATREEVYATYYDQLRHKVEDKGTENFPEKDGKKLYGELTMTLTINASGRLLSTEIVQSSGNRTLDRRAEAIARSAEPFGNFSPAMRRQADQIVVVSRFRFTRDETLEANVR